jgi:hypothetical protein
MGPELKRKWMAHLCGLCLTLKAEGGQSARMLTGYDLVLLSVLVEAQVGAAPRTHAGRCLLRGMRTAEVVPSSSPAARFAAAGSFLAGSAALEDKVLDSDLPALAVPSADRFARRSSARGRRLAGESGFDSIVLSRAARDAAAVEGPRASLDDLLAPSGRAVAALFAHTAHVAGRPANAERLAQVGDAFGRLAHLLDAVEDFEADRRRGKFNPLAATGTAPEQARRVATDLLASIREALAGVEMVDPELAQALLGPTLERSVARHFGPDQAAPERRQPGHATVGAVAIAAAPVALLGMFGRRWRRRPYYDDAYPPPGYGYGYGYGRRGPGCCECLACDCCANAACNGCGGGDDDCCICCC